MPPHAESTRFGTSVYTMQRINKTEKLINCYVKQRASYLTSFVMIPADDIEQREDYMQQAAFVVFIQLSIT